MYDVCIIGHVTRDIGAFNRRPGSEMPGGVVNYAGIALQSLGLKTVVITKAANVDADEILGRLRKIGVKVHWLASRSTTVFENNYSGNGLEFRNQKVRAIANTFDPRCLPPVWAKTFYLGPLTNGEMSAEFVKAVSERDGRVFLDVQGFLREVENGKVRLVDWPEKREVLAHVHVLKANLAEARFLSGEKEPERAARKLVELGPEEVILTFGGNGSLILAGGRLYDIPAYPPRVVADPTGCGDTYSAGYIFHRLQSDDIGAAGRFAAALAALKLERHGPFTGDAQEVQARLREAEAMAESDRQE